MEKRFSVLETKVAYHENNLADLNAEVFRQGRVIAELQAQLARMTSQLKELGIVGDNSPDQRPPHY